MGERKIIHEQTTTAEAFAKMMAKSWTCHRCGTEFFPTPDDPNSHSVGVQYEDVRQESGNYLRRIVGELCHNCMSK